MVWYLFSHLTLNSNEGIELLKEPRVVEYIVSCFFSCRVLSIRYKHPHKKGKASYTVQQRQWYPMVGAIQLTLNALISHPI